MWFIFKKQCLHYSADLQYICKTIQTYWYWQQIHLFSTQYALVVDFNSLWSRITMITRKKMVPSRETLMSTGIATNPIGHMQLIGNGSTWMELTAHYSMIISTLWKQPELLMDFNNLLLCNDQNDTITTKWCAMKKKIMQNPHNALECPVLQIQMKKIYIYTYIYRTNLSVVPSRQVYVYNIGQNCRLLNSMRERVHSQTVRVSAGWTKPLLFHSFFASLFVPTRVCWRLTAACTITMTLSLFHFSVKPGITEHYGDFLLFFSLRITF